MFTKEEIRCLEFVNKWVCGDSISDEDLNIVAYTDLSGFVQPFFDSIIVSFVEFMEQYGHDWTSRDGNYPYDSYHVGYEFNGDIYITDYIGDEGCYWNKESDKYTICRPW